MATLDENNTFQEWAELFLIYKRNKVSNGFFKSLRSSIAHANDFLCMFSLNEITPHQVDEVLFSEKLFNYRNHKPLSRKSIKNIRDVISNIYSFAFENNPQLAIRLYNPAKGRKLPSEASVTTRNIGNVAKRINIKYWTSYVYTCNDIYVMWIKTRGIDTAKVDRHRF